MLKKKINKQMVRTPYKTGLPNRSGKSQGVLYQVREFLNPFSNSVNRQEILSFGCFLSIFRNNFFVARSNEANVVYKGYLFL